MTSPQQGPRVPRRPVLNSSIRSAKIILATTLHFFTKQVQIPPGRKSLTRRQGNLREKISKQNSKRDQNSKTLYSPQNENQHWPVSPSCSTAYIVEHAVSQGWRGVSRILLLPRIWEIHMTGDEISTCTQSMHAYPPHSHRMKTGEWQF